MEGIEQYVMQKIEELTFTSVNRTDLLWTDKILDSITIVELAVAIELEYKIKIPNNEITIDHFDTVDSIVQFILKKLS
jgi:acyl carrier protein